MDVWVLLQVGGDGDGFAAGAADHTGSGMDRLRRDVELMEDGEAVVDAAGSGEVMRFDQFMVVHPELCHDNDWRKALVVDVGHLQFPLWGAAQQYHDGIGRLQLFFMHQPVPAAPEEEEQ